MGISNGKKGHVPNRIHPRIQPNNMFSKLQDAWTQLSSLDDSSEVVHCIFIYRWLKVNKIGSCMPRKDGCAHSWEYRIGAIGLRPSSCWGTGTTSFHLSSSAYSILRTLNGRRSLSDG